MNASLRSREGRDAMGCTTTSQRTLLTLGAPFNCTRDSATIRNEMKQLHSINQVFRRLQNSTFCSAFVFCNRAEWLRVNIQCNDAASGPQRTTKKSSGSFVCVFLQFN
jgi:hypothetical protein